MRITISWKRRPTDGAGHSSGNRQECNSLNFEDEQDHCVFWLNSLAGTGKSTITQTFAEISFVDGKLGASFFCSRDFEDRSNLHVIFPTLAFQLAYWYLPFREKLLRVLRAKPNTGRKSVPKQRGQLLAR